MNAEYLLRARAFHRPGVLARMTGMFYRRSLNIRSLSVGQEGDDGLVPIVVRVAGGAAEIERLALSMQNLIDVVSADVVPMPLTDGLEPGYECCVCEPRRDT